MPIAAIAGIALAAGGSMIAGKAQAKADKKAQAENERRAREMRSEEERLFHEQRGSEGYAFMPEYSTTGEGTAFEPQMFQQMREVYDATGYSPAEKLKSYEAIVNKYAPAQAGAQKAITGLFDGSTEAQLINQAKPVMQARLDVADQRKQAGLEALSQTINEIKMIQSGKGFTGDSLAANRMKFDARRGIFTDAANARAAANLTNAEDERNIKDTQTSMRLSNFNLPSQAGASEAQFTDLPNQLLTNSATQRAGAMKGVFNIGTGNFQHQVQLPMVTPVASNMQLFGQAMQQSGSAIGNLGAASMMNAQSAPQVQQAPRIQYFNTSTPAPAGTYYDPIANQSTNYRVY